MGTSKTIKGHKDAEKNIEGLEESRTERGLTRKELSLLSGVDQASLHRYEEKGRLPTIESYNKLARVFSWKKVSQKKSPVKRNISFSEIFESSPQEANPPLRERENKFEIGRRYQIEDCGSSKMKWIGEFEYEGKRGLHHIFREVIGKWQTTYTDAQLIGKSVTEVL